MEKAKIDLEIRSKSGGNPLWNPDKGEAIIFVDSSENYISADAFEGRGLTYKRRDETLIKIKFEDIIWYGTLKELVIKMGYKGF